MKVGDVKLFFQTGHILSGSSHSPPVYLESKVKEGRASVNLLLTSS